MSAAIIILLIGLMAVISISLISYSIITTRNYRRQQISKRLKEDAKRSSTVTKLAKQPERNIPTVRWFKEKAAPVLAKPVKPKSADEQSQLRIRLANAGIRKDSAPVVFLASKTILGIGLLILTLFLSLGAGHPLKKVLGFTLFAGGIGFLLPEVWLYLAIKDRQEKIRYALPDCLDLMVVSVEAGLGLDAALIRVANEMGRVHPELSEEFMITNMEMQMGLPRSEALSNLAERTGVSEVRSLTAMLIQAERFGTSIAKALRTHADSLRTKRRQEAEERAAKTAVKLILPLILFIFPAIFVVLAGPAVLKLWETLTSGVLTGK